MTGFTIDITCPTCGAPVALVNKGCATGTESKVLVRCERPRHGEWLVVCRMTHTTNDAGSLLARGLS